MSTRGCPARRTADGQDPGRAQTVDQQPNCRISSSRVRIQHASVAALPFPDRSFDVVTVVETHYYWPDLPASLREILRVLEPGGTFALIA